jgi:hypothetical protein
MFRRLFEWFSSRVAEAPEDVSACEFDCRQRDCLHGDWERCERRLKSMLPREESEER